MNSVLIDVPVEIANKHSAAALLLLGWSTGRCSGLRFVVLDAQPTARIAKGGFVQLNRSSGVLVGTKVNDCRSGTASIVLKRKLNMLRTFSATLEELGNLFLSSPPGEPTDINLGLAFSIIGRSDGSLLERGFVLSRIFGLALLGVISNIILVHGIRRVGRLGRIIRIRIRT